MFDWLGVAVSGSVVFIIGYIEGVRSQRRRAQSQWHMTFMPRAGWMKFNSSRTPQQYKQEVEE